MTDPKSLLKLCYIIMFVRFSPSIKLFFFIFLCCNPPEIFGILGYFGNFSGISNFAAWVWTTTQFYFVILVPSPVGHWASQRGDKCQPRSVTPHSNARVLCRMWHLQPLKLRLSSSLTGREILMSVNRWPELLTHAYWPTEEDVFIVFCRSWLVETPASAFGHPHIKL